MVIRQAWGLAQEVCDSSLHAIEFSFVPSSARKSLDRFDKGSVRARLQCTRQNATINRICVMDVGKKVVNDVVTMAAWPNMDIPRVDSRCGLPVAAKKGSFTSTGGVNIGVCSKNAMYDA